MTDTTQPVDTEDGRPTELLARFDEVSELLRHEGNGIWERFNILVGLNLALFAAFGIVCLGSSRPLLWRELGGVICGGGVFVGMWSHYVLGRLWERHAHWRDTLLKIQNDFPNGWEHPIDGEEQKKYKSKAARWLQFMCGNLTFPFLLVFLVAWGWLLFALLKWPSAFCSR